MPPKRFKSEKRNVPKIILLLSLITVLSMFSSTALSMYPQHLWISNTTKLGDRVQFMDNNTAIIKGNQVSYTANQIMPLEGRSYIRITANQAQFGGNTYQEGIRTVFAEWNQNLLLQQPIGSFNPTAQRAAQIGVDKTVITLIPISTDVINVNAVDLNGKKPTSNYNLQLAQKAYLSENGVMLELSKKDTNIVITLIGSGYKSIWMQVI